MEDQGEQRSATSDQRSVPEARPSSESREALPTVFDPEVAEKLDTICNFFPNSEAFRRIVTGAAIDHLQISQGEISALLQRATGEPAASTEGR